MYAYDAADAPDLATVQATGAIAINHYLTGIYAGTSAQPVDAHKHGLGSIITYEQGPSELIGLSRTGGRDVGNRILAAVKNLGVPLDGSVAVYPSVDVNVATDRMTTCDQAYEGLRDVLAGKLSIRCYGEYDLIQHLHDQQLTDGPGWLAGATSWSAGDHSTSPLVCMVQHVGSDIPSTDRNTVTQPHALGAWWPAGSPFLKEDIVQLDNDDKAWLLANLGPRPTWLTPINTAQDNAWTVLTQTRAAAAKQPDPAVFAAALVAALPKGASGTLTEADVEAAVRTVFADAAS